MLETDGHKVMKTNLHTMPTRGFIITFVIFITAFIVTLIVGSFGPNILSDVNSDNVTGLNFDGTSWTGKVSGLSQLNQQLILSASIVNTNTELAFQDAVVFVNVSVYGLDKDMMNGVLITHGIHKHFVDCEKGAVCDSLVLFYEPFISFYAYDFEVSLNQDSDSSFLDAAGYTSFTFTYINDNFTLFELWFRFVFLLITFAIIITFSLKLRGYHWDFWVLEQKWTAVILFGLLAFNNPLFPLQVLVQGWIPPFLDIFFMVSMLFLMLLFILVVTDGVRLSGSERGLMFYLPKFVLIGILWIFTIGVFSYREYNSLTDPASTIEGDLLLTIFTYGLPLSIVAYIIWLGASAMCACDKLEDAHLKRRLLFFLGFSILVIIIIALGILFNAFLYQNNASEFLALHSLVNLYVYTLVVVYLPSTSVEKVGYTKDVGEEPQTFNSSLSSIELDESFSTSSITL
eukprot:TRINITY_DN3463_c0_g1_i1.p1 TRINITY_DN3463_c0_g1~~TRINITY_DN3463_c0_g1_i1.p1  ORF type:complete len:458 (-),score=79.90 TRINITY_DN3463_c0_g1_i1:26-1399(-)